jgi:hypothetical protein
MATRGRLVTGLGIWGREVVPMAGIWGLGKEGCVEGWNRERETERKKDRKKERKKERKKGRKVLK